MYQSILGQDIQQFHIEVKPEQEGMDRLSCCGTQTTWAGSLWSFTRRRGLSLMNRGDHFLGRLKAGRYRLPFGFVYPR